MVDCPNCNVEMTIPQPDVDAPLSALAGACVNCSLLWFDASSGARMPPREVLGLFKFIADAKAPTSVALASGFTCPRCKHSLLFTNDLQHTTRFTYWRCAYDRGQLITFSQFLREKNFVRTLSSSELAKLREAVKQISCSQCGAPVDLTKESACGHCGAPISMIDPDGIAKAMHDLNAEGSRQGSPTNAEVARASISNAQLDAMFELERMQRQDDEHPDLLAIGVGAVAAIVGGLLLAER
jgi:hypothetical protein